jgi:hypothetical protein
MTIRELDEQIRGRVSATSSSPTSTALAAAPDYPDRAEPCDAVFACGDDLELYRRLVEATAERLTRAGALVFQLHRRVVETGRDELPLRVALGATQPSVAFGQA